MTKYLLAFVAVVGMGTVGCGGDDCTDGADRIKAKAEECGLTTGTTDSDSSSSDAECTEEAGALAQKTATCYEAASCEALKGEDTAGATTFAECVTK